MCEGVSFGRAAEGEVVCEELKLDYGFGAFEEVVLLQPEIGVVQVGGDKFRVIVDTVEFIGREIKGEEFVGFGDGEFLVGEVQDVVWVSNCIKNILGHSSYQELCLHEALLANTLILKLF